MIKLFLRGLNGDRPLFGAQITFAIQLRSGDGYNGVEGYIVGNSGDGNGDGLADEGSLFWIHAGRPMGISASSVTPELYEYMSELNILRHP
jgi:hypothetical protein